MSIEPATGDQVTTATDVVATMAQAYADAVNASDSAAYSRLYTKDAIRMPAGGESEHGPEKIRAGEQAFYDASRWSVELRPVDALEIGNDWIYGIVDVEVTTTAHGDGAQTHITATKSWLLQRQPTGEWLLARHMWSVRSEEPVG